MEGGGGSCAVDGGGGDAGRFLTDKDHFAPNSLKKITDKILDFWQLYIFFALYLIFSCPEQLNKWPCPLLACLIGPLGTTNNQRVHNITEWPLRHLIRQIFVRFSDFLKIFRFLEDFQIFGRFSDFWKIFKFLEDFQLFARFSDFWTIFSVLEDFQIFGHPRTFDIWDTDYNSDNWEPEFMTIFVIWHLIVTLDSRVFQKNTFSKKK